MNFSYIFWKVRFELSRLWLPINPIIYDSKYNPGDVTDYYERYLITREIRGYRLWYIYFFVPDGLVVRKLMLFTDKNRVVCLVKQAVTEGNYCLNKFFT